MPPTSFPLTLIFQKLDNGLILAENLLFPEVSRLGRHRTQLRPALERNASRLLEQVTPGARYRRLPGPGIVSRRFSLRVAPPKPQLFWREGLTLDFPLVIWPHLEEAQLVRVPTLGIDIIVPKSAPFDELVESELRLALARTRCSTQLAQLLRLPIPTQFAIESRRIELRLPSLKQRAIRLEQDRDQKPSILPQVATELSDTALSPAYEMGEFVAQIADAFTARRPRSVLLVGPNGVGKSAAYREFVRCRRDFQLATTPFYMTSGSRLVAGMSGFGMWQERCKQVWAEAAKKRAVLHLGNLIELMEVGKSEHNRTGIAGFLRPYIARGDLLVVSECTPEQISMIERDEPQLLDGFQRIDIVEPDGPTGRTILDAVAVEPLPGRSRRRSITDVGMAALDRLHRRYATYSGYPGRPLRFLRNLLFDENRAPELPVDAEEVLSAFTRETGLPRVLLDPAERLDLVATRDWFQQRVIGQTEAVSLVVNLLATVKAGLTRPQQPIASLLFVGPTGVGKTEMAKALAEFLFGSRDRLTRFDMSEYADPVAVQRLVGYGGREGLLTAKVREQPFAVILFDEFEKAHPSFFDLLLQMLSAARLTDAAGRLADFRNAVVILTSNLGAESYQQGSIGLRGAALSVDAREHFTTEVRKFLRPEMVNRFDRIVPFLPLDETVIRQIAQREWAKLLLREGVRHRGLILQPSEEVLPYLAKHGFDIRYGARPLKRAIERELLAPLAHQANRYAADQSLQVDVRMQSEALRIDVKPRKGHEGRMLLTGESTSPLSEIARKASDWRRSYQRLERCNIIREIHNEIYELERREKAVIKEGKERERATLLARLGRLRQLRETVLEQVSHARALEELCVLSFYERCEVIPPDALESLVGHVTAISAELTTQLQQLVARWDQLLVELYNLRIGDPGGVTLALFGEDREWMWELARAYRMVGEREQETVTMVAYRPAPHRPARDEIPANAKWIWRDDVLLASSDNTPAREILAREKIIDPRAFLNEPDEEVIGLVMRFTGPAAHLRYRSEEGVHLRRSHGGKNREGGQGYVLVSESSLLQYVPPMAATRRGGLSELERRRTYDPFHGKLEDPRLKEPRPLYMVQLHEILGEVIREHARATLERLVLE